jgi:hypothetical protein
VSQVLVNGLPAFWAELRIPRIGAWDADVNVPREGGAVALPPGPVVISVGTLTWAGFVRRSGENKGTLSARIVGGMGGLSRTLLPRAYQGVPVRIPLTDLLAEVGERLSPTSDPAILGTVLQKWNRAAGPAGIALASLLAASGAAWRVLPDGSIWVGRDLWLPSKLVDYVYVEQAPNAGALEIVAATPSVYPGELFEMRRVSVVTHRFDGSRVRTRILFEEDAKEDRLKSGLLAMVRSAFPKIDFLASYWCRVVAQNPDGTLELFPDNPLQIAGLSNVPIRYGVPGVKATVAPGARVLLGFAGGDPSQPFATVWESASLLKLEVLGAEVVVGTGPTQPAAVATALRTELDALWDVLGSHVHPVATTGTASAQSGTASAATVVPSKQTIASSRVKVSM